MYDTKNTEWGTSYTVVGNEANQTKAALLAVRVWIKGSKRKRGVSPELYQQINSALIAHDMSNAMAAAREQMEAEP